MLGIACNAHLGTQFQTQFGVRENGNAACFILQIDRVKELGVRICSTCSHITFNNEDFAQSNRSRLTDLCNGSNLGHLSGNAKNVLIDGAVCIRQIPHIIKFCLYFKVRYKDATRREDSTTVSGILSCDEHSIALLQSANAISIGVNRVGSVEALNQPCSVACVYSTAGVLAISLTFNQTITPLGSRVKHTGIQTICLTTIVFFVISFIIIDSQRRANCFKKLIQLSGSMIIGRGRTLILIVCQATNDHAATTLHKCLHRIDEFIFKQACSVVTCIGRTSLLGRCRDNQQAAIIKHFCSDLFGFHMNLNTLRCRDGGHITGVATIVASYVVIEVSTIHDHFTGNLSRHNGNFQILRIGLFNAIQSTLDCGSDRIDTVLVKNVIEGTSSCAFCTNLRNRAVSIDYFACVLVREDKGTYQQILLFIIEQFQIESLLFTGNGQIRCSSQAGNTNCLHLTEPNRSSDSNITIRLNDLNIVIVIGGRNAESNSVVAGSCLTCSCIAAIYNNGNCSACRVSRINQSNRQVHSAANIRRIQNRTHNVAIQSVVDSQIVIFCCIDTVVTHCIVDIGLSQSVYQNNASAGIGIAPQALMVILVIRGCHMPALIQSAGIILVRGEITGRANRALAVTNLD